MFYIFYSNDPLGVDQGGGVEHIRGLYRALKSSNCDFTFVASRNSDPTFTHPEVVYIAKGSNFFHYYLSLWRWFISNRKSFVADDVFHFHRNYVAWPKYLLAGQTGRTVITYHGLTGNVIREKLGLLAYPFRFTMKILERASLSRADAIIFVSARDLESMADGLLKGIESKALVIPAAFNRALFAKSSAPNVSLSHRVVLIGRLSEIKNIPLAIDAILLLRRSGYPYFLTIVGEGEDRAVIENYIAKHNCSDFISLSGKVSHNLIPMIMAEHGIVLMTSRSEASPTVVKEAIASRRPIVSTDVGDASTWIKNGTNGFVCRSDPGSVADGLRAATDLVECGSYNQGIDLGELDEEAVMTKVISVYRRLSSVV